MADIQHETKHETTRPKAIELWLEETLPDYRFGLVLVLLLMTYAFMATAPSGNWVRVVNTTLQGLTLLAALRASQVSRRLFRFAALVVLVAFLGSLGSLLVSSSSDANGALDIVSLLMVGAAPMAIARALYRRPVVDVHTVMGAICIYVLIGMLFAFAYDAIGLLGSEPFFVQTQSATTSDYLYFSFITLTTVGYGDYTAASGLGRSLASLEALLGQIYLVTVVATIVSGMARLRFDTRAASTPAGDDTPTPTPNRLGPRVGVLTEGREGNRAERGARRIGRAQVAAGVGDAEHPLRAAAADHRRHPAAHGGEAAPEPVEEREVHEHPHQPRGKAAQPEAPEAAHRAEAADGRHTPEIAVAERRRAVLAAEPAGDRVRRVQTALASRPRRRPAGCSSVTMSPTTNTSGCPGRVRSGSTAMWPLRSTSAPVADASCAASGDACTPAAQTTVCASMRSRAVARPHVDAGRVDVDDPRAHHQLHADVDGARGQPPPERRSPNVVSGSLPPSTSSTRTVAGIEGAELAAQASRRQLADLPRDLDAGRAGADDHDREPLLLLGRVGATSAISNAPKIRRFSSSASSMVFIPGANSANSSCPKYDCPAPAATIRLS